MGERQPVSGQRPFAFQSGALEVGASGEVPFAAMQRLGRRAVNVPSSRATRMVTGSLTPAADGYAVEFIPEQPLDRAQEQAADALRAWAATERVALRFATHDIADYPCPVCGSAVVDWICANRGIGGTCGYITCPICANGFGGSNTVGLRVCPHYVATLPGDLELAQGPLLDAHAEEELPLFERSSPGEVARLLGDRLESGRAAYPHGFDKQGSIVSLYEALILRHGGHSLESVMDSGGLAGTWWWRDVFVPDPTAFERELREAAASLREAARGSSTEEST